MNKTFLKGGLIGCVVVLVLGIFAMLNTRDNNEFNSYFDDEEFDELN